MQHSSFMWVIVCFKTFQTDISIVWHCSSTQQTHRNPLNASVTSLCTVHTIVKLAFAINTIKKNSLYYMCIIFDLKSLFFSCHLPANVIISYRGKYTHYKNYIKFKLSHYNFSTKIIKQEKIEKEFACASNSKQNKIGNNVVYSTWKISDLGF